MAIFKRNREQHKTAPIAFETPVEKAAIEEEAKAEAAKKAREEAEGFQPVLAFGTENAAKTPPRPEPKEAPDEVAGELSAIEGIFDSSKSASSMSKASLEAAQESITASQSRWFARRKQAMEKVKEENRRKAEAEAKAAAEVAGEAPIIEPMQSVPEKKKTRTRREMRPKPENPVSLAFADLSDREDLEPFEIEDATDIYGIKYPAGFDTSQVNYNGRAIDFSNFSLVDGLRWAHIEGASDISGVVFPSSFDVDHAAFYGRSLRSCDFSAVYALKWKHIETAEDIAGIKYPATFDISEANFDSRNISGSDFSLVRTLRWENIAAAADISGIKYPTDFDIDNAEFEGRDISGSDFSLVRGLRWSHIREALSIRGIIYPAEFDFSGVDFSGRDIAGSDFTRAASFSYECIKNALDIRRIKYPDCFDAAQSRFDGRNISGSNFSRVASLRFRHIRSASDITRLVYPPQFDIDNADFSGRDIDYSDFSLLPGFNWQSVRLAESREGLVYPASFVVPTHTAEEIEGAMLIFLLKLYTREYGSDMEISQFYSDISALYPGVDEAKAAELIDSATAKWEQPDGKRFVELTAREEHIGNKLFMLKLGFKLLYPRHGADLTEKLLREQFAGIFKKHEKDRFERRLSELRHGKYLSAAELSEIGFAPVTEPKAERRVDFSDEPEEAVVQYTAPEPPIASDDAPAPVISESDEVSAQPAPQTSGKAYSFGHVDVDVANVTLDEAIKLPDDIDPEKAQQLLDAPVSPEKPETLPESKPAPGPVPKPAPGPAPAPEPEASEDTFEAPPLDKYAAKPVDLSKLRRQRAAESAKKPVMSPKKEKLSDEEKAIRTGVMGMLLYIHQNTSDEPLSNAELFSEFMKIYPGAAPKEAAAMAQFASNTLNGTDVETRSKLFMFASRTTPAVKRKLLDFAYEEYVYKLSETADEEIFRDFLLALCNTLYEDSPEYEFSSYLRSRDILKNPPLRREASYRRISFESHIGKANLYASDRYPYVRTLEKVGFAHFTFDAIRGNLLIEESDSRYYEELETLVYRKREPNLLQFVIIDTQMGYLYLEQRCLDYWNIDARDVWAAAEENMRGIELRPKYSFASSEFSSFRYIQHDLASYVLSMPELMRELACGQDLILSVPCREIVYIDYYDFGAIKKMLEFSSRYNCTLIINGEEFEHPFSSDVFIYHAMDETFERVNDETYILLGDSVARRQVLRSVLPLNIEFNKSELSDPLTTDDVPFTNEDQCIVQEAVFTLLRLYSEMNGDNDYTVPQNAFMSIVDEDFIPFDCVYPPPRGRERPEPLEHIDEAAAMAMNGGKQLCWLMVQAIQNMCGDIKYETASSGHIRETLLSTIYGDNANAVWLNCATAADFAKRYDAVSRYFELPVENQHLTILDSKVEVAMHVLTMIFHQFGHRYALGQVRRHILKAIPDITFTYEINQSAWLPSPGDDIDVDAQSLGMIFRGFDHATQERMLSVFADAIGDRDLSEGGWPLLYFIKFVKYSYLDPAKTVERFFAGRSRLIPSQTVLKQLYYKDVNNEFVKHSRTSPRAGQLSYDDAFEDRRNIEVPTPPTYFDDLPKFPEISDFTPVDIPRDEPVAAGQRPDIQLMPVEKGYLEKHLNFVLEEVNEQSAASLREAAHYVTKIFHVPEVMFKANDDIECELHYGVIRSREQITTLRSFAWTLAAMLLESGRTMRDVTEKDVQYTVEVVEDNNRIHYKSGSKYFPVLCSMPLDEGMYIPSYQEYIFFAQELLPEAKLASLFTLQDELMQLAPAMKLSYDILRAQKRGDIMPPRGVLFDVICAWSAYSFACGEAFEVVTHPQVRSYNQIPR